MTEGSLEAGRAVIRRLFDAAIEAANPEDAVVGALKRDDDVLVAGARRFSAPQGVHIVSVGKAAVAMTRGALRALDGLVVSGDVITKEGHVDNELPPSIRAYEAGHPIPDQRGVDATRAALDALESLPPGSVVLALISGGGSALLEAPWDPITLADFASTTDQLLRAGAPIDALNAVRAPLSRVKAGGLRAAAARLPWVTLVLSDVLGNDPRIIASGPTIPGRNDPELALAIVDRYGLRESLPGSVIQALVHGDRRSRERQDDRDELLIIGDNSGAVDAAATAAKSLGLRSQVVWQAVEGEAADLGRAFVALADQAVDSVDVLLGGGEATVTVHGDGVGGRNTEFALAAALELERRGMSDWLIASLATDGQDALTGLAGAVADPETAQRARERGVDPETALQHNDSRAVFEVAGGAVDTGPTGTNVNDLYFAIRVSRLPKQDA